MRSRAGILTRVNIAVLLGALAIPVHTVAQGVLPDLNVSTRTVESHKYDLMAKLGLQTTAALIQYAIKRGIVSL